MSSVHLACDNAGKQVTCDRCGRSYVCSLTDDYYCTPDGDHSCEACLIGGLQLLTVDDADLAAMGLSDQLATCQHCGHSITRRPGRAWEDASGTASCVGGGHEPVASGVDGAPVEVPGTAVESVPIANYPQWRL